MNKLHFFHNAEDSITFQAGQVIFKEGDTGDVMYAVLDGEVEIWVGDKKVDTLTADDIFGEMALIDGGPRSATALAKTTCKVMPVSEKRFNAMVRETPYFALNVMRIMSARLRRMNQSGSAAEIQH